MKKLLNSVLAIIFAASLIGNLYVFAAGTLTLNLNPGSTTIRSGDIVTVTGKIDSSVPVATFDLKVTYDAAKLDYVKAEALGLSSGSTLDILNKGDGIQFIYLDGAGLNATVKSANFFKITFKAKSNLQVGSTAKIDAVIDVAGEGSGKAITTSVRSCTLTVAAPLSNNNYLSSLSTDKGALTPTFDKTKTTYSISVPFDVANLNVTAQAEDSKAKVTVSSTGLRAGRTTNITVTVKAENGSERVYTIKASRAADPNAASSAMPSSTASSSASTVSTASSQISSQTTSSEIKTNNSSAVSSKPVKGGNNSDSPLGLMIVLVVLSLAVGFAAGFITSGKLVRR